MTPDEPKHIALAPALGTLLAAFPLRRSRKSTRTWLTLVLDLLPLAWTLLSTPA